MGARPVAVGGGDVPKSAKKAWSSGQVYPRLVDFGESLLDIPCHRLPRTEACQIRQQSPTPAL